MDEWYEDLKDFTFKTFMIPLSVDEAKVFCQIHKRYEAKDTYEISVEEKEKLSNLKSQVEKSLKTFGDKAFIKMSSRSPKDVTNERFDGICKKELEKVKDLTDNNQRCWAILRSSLMLLQVTSSDQVLDLLIRSDRVYEDFQEEFKREKFSISIILREWMDIEVDLEFRGFVYQGKLNAISQYNCSCFFLNVVEQKSELQKKIFEFFDNVQPKIKGICDGNLILDFCIVKDQVYFIELNTFDIASQACLFSWKNEMKLLKEGPFEFRLIETPIDHIERFVPKEYQKYLYQK